MHALDLGDAVILLPLSAGAIGAALLAGVFFTFSAFVMPALAKLEPAQGAAAMRSINRTVLRSAFMPLFLGTALISALLLVAGLPSGRLAAPWTVAAGALAVLVGSFLCTLVFNVPLNRELEAAQGPGTAVEATWARYLRSWTGWNHLRCGASALASLLYLLAITLQAASHPA
jgi:uncharacterized membrane protein